MQELRNVLVVDVDVVVDQRFRSSARDKPPHQFFVELTRDTTNSQTYLESLWFLQISCLQGSSQVDQWTMMTTCLHLRQHGVNLTPSRRKASMAKGERRARGPLTQLMEPTDRKRLRNGMKSQKPWCSGLWQLVSRRERRQKNPGEKWMDLEVAWKRVSSLQSLRQEIEFGLQPRAWQVIAVGPWGRDAAWIFLWVFVLQSQLLYHSVVNLAYLPWHVT